MSGVDFEPPYISTKKFEDPRLGPSFFVRMLIKLRIAKDERVANYILVAFATAAFTISIFIYSDVFTQPGGSEKYYEPPVSKEFARMMVRSEFPSIPSEVFNRLPDYFYREDIPDEVLKLLPTDFINLIPQEPK